MSAEKKPGDVVWVCPECGSTAIEPLDDPDWDGSELISSCQDCGHSGEDDEFRTVVVSTS